jgi:hypothetical protein
MRGRRRKTMGKILAELVRVAVEIIILMFINDDKEDKKK